MKDEELKNLVKRELSDYLGVNPEDIDDNDSLSLDLHMKASDIVDFFANLEKRGIDTSGISLTEIDTVAELIDALHEV